MRKNKLLTIFAVLVFAFLIIPLIIITVTAFGGGNAITFPIESFSMKWFLNVFSLKSFRKSFLTSLEIAFLATFIALLVGIPAAYALARSGMRGKGILKSVFLSPTIVPGIVIGFVLYQFLVLSLRIPVYAGLLAGHFMVTLPYVIRVDRVWTSLISRWRKQRGAWAAARFPHFSRWCFRISRREFLRPLCLRLSIPSIIFRYPCFFPVRGYPRSRQP